MAVLGQVGDAGVHRGRRAREADGVAVEPDLARVALVDPEQDAGDLRPAGADEPGEPDDLAVSDVEGDVAEDAGAGQALDLEEDLADRRLDLREERHAPADHVPDEVGRGEVRGRRRDDVPAVAEDRRAVAQLEDLVEPVADEQDRDATRPQVADDREQALDLVRRERRRRLVEDQDARLDRQRLGDLDELLVGHRQAADRRADVELDVELLEQGLRGPPRRAPVEDPEPAGRGVADEHVLGDGQVREEARLLVDDGDAEGAGVGGAVDLGRLAVERDRAAVGLVDAGQDLDQRALAGAVLADQGVDLARDEVERDVVERLGRREALGDPAQLGARRRGDGRLLGHRHEPRRRASPRSAPIEPDLDAAPDEVLDHRPRRPSSEMTTSIAVGRAERRERGASPTSCGRRWR